MKPSLTQAEWWEARANYVEYRNRQWASWDSPHRLWILDHLGGVETLHEIGCGTGANLRLLQAKRPDIRLSGSDSSETYVQWAREHLGIPILHEQLPTLSGGPWDAVLCLYVLSYLQPQQAFLTLLRLRAMTQRLLIAEPWAEKASYLVEQPGFRDEKYYCEQWHHHFPDWMPHLGWSLTDEIPLEGDEHLRLARVYV